MTVFSSLKECSPYNIIPLVNSIVGVKFAIPLSIEECDRHLIFKDSIYNILSCKLGFYHAEKAFIEFCHHKDNWCLEYLSDEITILIGKLAFFPIDVQYNYSAFMYQIQETMNIYGGILRITSDKWKLPDKFCIKYWEFFKCSPDTYELAMKKQKNLDKVYASLAAADPIKSTDHLISMLPLTTSIRRFQGQYLTIPFHKLSTSFVFRSSVHNSPLFDALSADPVSKRLFLFQSTLLDPKRHRVSIPAFNSVLLNLIFDESKDKIDEIYFYMIASAHHRIELQHFFSFSLEGFHLNACFLKDFASDAGQAVLKKVVFVKDSPSHLLAKNLSLQGGISFSVRETKILQKLSIGFTNDINYIYVFEQKDYDAIFKFLQVASKIRPFICRAPFTASDVN